MHAQALRYLVTVARHGSIRSASEELHVANSAVGRQIAKLEETLDVQLFERLPRGLSLTGAGERVLAHAEETLRAYELLKSDLEDLRGRVSGDVQIATLESWCESFLPTALLEFSQQYPDVRYRVRSTTHSRICDLLLDGDVDFGISFDLPYPGDLELVGAVPMPLRAMVSPDHPLALRREVTMKECAEFPLSLQVGTEPVRSIIAMELGEASRAGRVVMTSNNLHLHRSFVCAGRAVTFFTEAAFRKEIDDGRVVPLPLRHSRLSELKLGILKLRKRKLTSAADAGLTELQKWIKRVSSGSAPAGQCP